MARRTHHPTVAIPPGAAPPTNPSPILDSWNFLVTPPERDSFNLWSETSTDHNPLFLPSSAPNAAPHFPVPQTSSRPHSRAASAYESRTSHFVFPEPEVHRSISTRSSIRPSPSLNNLGHRSTQSEAYLTSSPIVRGESRPPSFAGSEESSPEV